MLLVLTEGRCGIYLTGQSMTIGANAKLPFLIFWWVESYSVPNPCWTYELMFYFYVVQILKNNSVKIIYPKSQQSGVLWFSETSSFFRQGVAEWLWASFENTVLHTPHKVFVVYQTQAYHSEAWTLPSCKTGTAWNATAAFASTISGPASLLCCKSPFPAGSHWSGCMWNHMHCGQHGCPEACMAPLYQYG